MTLFDYLEDQEKEEIQKITEIDVLVFHKLVYLPFEEFVSDYEKITILEAYKRNIQKNVKIKEQDFMFFTLAASCNRYKNLWIQNIRSKIDYEKEEQFMAMTILLPDESLYVAYRGTTEKLVGWKEDFNMIYMIVPAQKDALAYLNQINTHQKIYVGGHSKGGNLAMYAFVNAQEEIKKNIIQVYNYDGPGFTTIDSKYKSSKEKIISYIPNDSIVGRLFKIEHKTNVIKSLDHGLKQHDLSRWYIKNNSLVLSILSKESIIIKKIIDFFLEKIEKEEWENFINHVYHFLISIGIKNVNQLTFDTLHDIISSYQELHKEHKKIVLLIVKYLFSEKKDDILIRELEKLV